MANCNAIGAKIWRPIILEGSIDLMFTGNGFGRNWAGPFVTAYTERHAHWKERANTLPEVLKVLLVGARWFAG